MGFAKFYTDFASPKQGLSSVSRSHYSTAGGNNVISHRFSCFNSGHELNKRKDVVTRACSAISLGQGNKGKTHCGR